MKDQLFKLFGLRVELKAYGIEYRGKFMGADEDFVYLKCETTWITLPLMDVSSIKIEGAAEASRLHRIVDGEIQGLTEEERLAKRRYFIADRLKLVEPENLED